MHIIITYEEYKCLKNVIHQIDSKTEWLFIAASFRAKFVFLLTLENGFCQRFHFKTNRKSKGFSKNGTRDFQSKLPFERLPCFYVTISKNFEHFQYFNFETDFLENENVFQKSWSTAFQLKVLRLKTHHLHTKLSYVKTNRMGSTTCNYHEEEIFASNCFIFLKILFQFKSLL